MTDGLPGLFSFPPCAYLLFGESRNSVEFSILMVAIVQINVNTALLQKHMRFRLVFSCTFIYFGIVVKRVFTQAECFCGGEHTTESDASREAKHCHIINICSVRLYGRNPLTCYIRWEYVGFSLLECRFNKLILQAEG